jgi:hypothetical protein
LIATAMTAVATTAAGVVDDPRITPDTAVTMTR